MYSALNLKKTLYRKQVDIYRYPKPEERFPYCAEAELAFGDLHANFVKLIYFLLLHNLIDMSEAEYEELVALYQARVSEVYAVIKHNEDPKNNNDKKSIPAIEEKVLKTFDEIIQQLQVKPIERLILIGDLLSDRGADDTFFLRFLPKLELQKNEILLSNHDVEFMLAHEVGIFFAKNDEEKAKPFNYVSAGIVKKQTPSIWAFDANVQAGRVQQTDINDTMATHYLPKVKLLAYALAEDQKSIILYSHAPIGLNTIAKLAQRLNVTYNDASAAALAQTIDHINKKFTDELNKNNLNGLLRSDFKGSSLHDNEYKNVKDKVNDRQEINDYPVYAVAWNRNYDSLQRPSKHKGYRLGYVHGHDLDDFDSCDQPHIINLDNQLGKGDTFVTCGDAKKEYTVFATAPLPVPINSERLLIMDLALLQDALIAKGKLTQQGKEIIVRLATLSKKYNCKIGLNLPENWPDYLETFRQLQQECKTQSLSFPKASLATCSKKIEDYDCKDKTELEKIFGISMSQGRAYNVDDNENKSAILQAYNDQYKTLHYVFDREPTVIAAALQQGYATKSCLIGEKPIAMTGELAAYAPQPRGLVEAIRAVEQELSILRPITEEPVAERETDSEDEVEASEENKPKRKGKEKVRESGDEKNSAKKKNKPRPQNAFQRERKQLWLETRFPDQTQHLTQLLNIINDDSPLYQAIVALSNKMQRSESSKKGATIIGKFDDLLGQLNDPTVAVRKQAIEKFAVYFKGLLLSNSRVKPLKEKTLAERAQDWLPELWRAFIYVATSVEIGASIGVGLGVGASFLFAMPLSLPLTIVAGGVVGGLAGGVGGLAAYGLAKCGVFGQSMAGKPAGSPVPKLSAEQQVAADCHKQFNAVITATKTWAGICSN